ncbi:hypothetical protein ACFQ3P_40605 [Paraburkholderia sabiae]|jgi:hypothetical protein|uniref:Poly-beta-1,6-N-acetyl-D-glucosamine biosynthesis protein PgaD n=1 Tax=Paraburkholderia sabiae TaxID=273251 RepID=A0ABU9QR87_9BURK|nr:hypothetical protein [Paraburkholderia sabiae]WJZ72700.1 hypothetical protein QEN71_21395 [Paraburkholderia sabiae]CAD6562426.1 hypothetical protein LMG24235_07700 [Paraburkholderia sabiae]CAG9210189.1 conserved hypothetical protein [Paraburkholderia sabiae]
MEYPIIDVSKQSVAQFASDSSKAKAVRAVAWYRFVRPTLVLGTWVLAALYIRWCLANASEEELSLDAFMPGIMGIAIVVLSMVLWTFGRQMDAMNEHRVRRMPQTSEVAQQSHTAHEIPEGDAGRCLVAYHDDDGMISHVMSVPEFERQAA